MLSFFFTCTLTSFHHRVINHQFGAIFENHIQQIVYSHGTYFDYSVHSSAIVTRSPMMKNVSKVGDNVAVIPAPEASPPEAIAAPTTPATTKFFTTGIGFRTGVYANVSPTDATMVA